MGMSKVGFFCLVAMAAVLVFLTSKAEAGNSSPLELSYDRRPKCESKSKYVPGCIKPCRRGKCGACGATECADSDGKCWTKFPWRMSCDCSQCMPYTQVTDGECYCANCACKCAGADALAMSATESFSYASTYSAASAESSAKASSEANAAAEDMKEIGDYVASYSKTAEILTKKVRVEVTLKITKALEVGQCECDHKAMAAAMAQASACATATSEATAMAQAAAKAYAKASAYARAVAYAAAAANAQAEACAYAEVEAGAMSMAAAKVEIGGDCDGATAKVYVYADSAANASSRAKACASTVARTYARALAKVRTLVQIKAEVRTQTNVELAVKAKVSACVSGVADALAICDPSKCDQTKLSCGQSPMASKCMFWVMNKSYHVERAPTETKTQSGGNL